MSNYTKKGKKSLNKEKEERRRKLGKRLEEEIEKKYKTKKAFREECTKHSNYADSPSGNEYISASALSNFIHGESPIPQDRAKVFADVLKLPVDYILGLQDYPSEEAKEEAEFMDAIKAFNKEDQERIATFKRVLSILSDRQFQFYFELKETYEVTPPRSKKCIVSAQICSANMQYYLIDNGTQNVPESEFFSWLTNNTGTIKHSSNKWYHLNGKVQIFSNNSQWIETDINSFMRMVYDIDESIKATIQNRCDFWMNYANYDYKQALKKEY